MFKLISGAFCRESIHPRLGSARSRGPPEAATAVRAVAPRVEAVPVPARVAANALGAADPQMLGLDTEASFALQKVMIDIDCDFIVNIKVDCQGFTT